MASQKKKDQIAELYRQYRHSLLIIAVSYTRSLADAEDLIQSAFTKAILSYETNGSFLFWVNKVMRNEWYSIVRKRQKERSLDGLPEISSPSPDPLEKLIQDDNRRMLAIMIADLPERYRDIMIEYVYLGRSDEQIAADHHTNAANIRKIRSRAKKMLEDRRKEHNE